MEQRLRDKIEEMTGRTMKTPRDFTWLSGQVEERTGERVSGSTLRRFWGYVSEGRVCHKSMTHPFSLRT